MTKIVASFLILLSIISFMSAYIQTDLDKLNQITQMESSMASPFSIPDVLLLADPEEVYPVLLESARQTNVNIFRSGINNRPDNKVEIVKYILLTGSTQLYNVIHIADNKVMTARDTQAGSHFLSSVLTGDPHQIGRIRDFGNNNLITVSPLRLSYQHLPVAGAYFAEAPNHQVFQKFLTLFAQKLNAKFAPKVPFTSDSFAPDSNVTDTQRTSGALGYLTYTQYVLFFLVLLLFIFSVVQQSKSIGVYQMHGFSGRKIWFLIMGKMIVVTGTLSVVLAILPATLIPNTDLRFVGRIIVYQLEIYSIILLISWMVSAYIFRIGLHQIIKNRRGTTPIFILNTLTKIICSIVIVILGVSNVHEYANLIQQQDHLKRWESIKDYGVFYPLYTGYDIEDTRKGAPKFFKIVSSSLYPVVNKMGALLINTREYEETALILNKDYKGIRSISVNNNYLQAYPLYDNQQKPIHISEDNRKRILLVPDKYRNKEPEILRFFKENWKSSLDNEMKFYKAQVPEHLKNPEFQIIWLKNNQNVFSFNPDVFKAEYNVILDSIIQVITENNSLSSDREGILGNGGTDPLKIKLINRDSAQTYKVLEPLLKKLRLDDRLKYLITVDQHMLMNLYHLQSGIRIRLLLISVLLVGLLFLVAQNLTVLFKKYQQVFVIRRLFGFGFLGTYKEFIIWFTALWMIQAVLVFLLIQQAADLAFFLVLALFIVIELTAGVITLILIERKNQVQVLKGGVI